MLIVTVRVKFRVSFRIRLRFVGISFSGCYHYTSAGIVVTT